jgi:hypothetical protein
LQRFELVGRAVQVSLAGATELCHGVPSLLSVCDPAGLVNPSTGCSIADADTPVDLSPLSAVTTIRTPLFFTELVAAGLP